MSGNFTYGVLYIVVRDSIIPNRQDASAKRLYLSLALIIMEGASKANFLSFNEGVLQLVLEWGTSHDLRILQSKHSLKFDMANDPYQFIYILALLCPEAYSIGIMRIYIIINIYVFIYFDDILIGNGIVLKCPNVDCSFSLMPVEQRMLMSGGVLSLPNAVYSYIIVDFFS